MTKALVLAASVAALERAQTKHPKWPTDPIHAAGIVSEESGELQKAILEATYEGASHDHVREEALDVAGAALRFLLSLDRYNYQPSPQHIQS